MRKELLQNETSIIECVVFYLTYNFEPTPLFFHAPLEGKRGFYSQHLLKITGAKAGFPDLVIFEPRGKFCGLAIEIKREKGRVSPHQQEWIEALASKGWFAKVCFGLEDCIKTIDDYFSLKPIKKYNKCPAVNLHRVKMI